MARLRGLLLNASSESIAYELAQKLLAIGGKPAAPFLLEQAGAGGYRAEAAIAALQESPEAASEALVRGLETTPDNQHLARALPLALSPALVHRLIDLVPRLTDAPTLRYLAQRIAHASPPSVPALRDEQRRSEHDELALAICTGLAAAGDAAAFADLEERLPQATNPHVRLMLSCRALAQSPPGITALRKLLRSDSCGDRAYALRAIGGLSLDSLANEVAAAFVSEEDEMAAVEAFSALPVALPHLTEAELAGMVARACDLSGLEAQRSCQAGDLARAAQQWAGRADRICFIVALAAAGSSHLLGPLIVSAAHVFGLFNALLMAGEVEREGSDAGSHLLEIQRRCVAPLWEIDRVHAADLRAKLAGIITTEMLAYWGATPAEIPSAVLLDGLHQQCRRAADLAVEAQFREEPERRAQAIEVARNALRRLDLLGQLHGQPELGRSIVTALRHSREREAAAVLVVDEAAGSGYAARLQTILDQRPLMLREEERLVGDFLRRRGRGWGTDLPQEPAGRLLSEQVLQIDLCALCGVLPLPERAVASVVELLSSASALVRASARGALARQTRASAELRGQLRRHPDARVQAQLLEVLRCLGCARSLGFARKALVSEDELLRASATHYVGQFGDADDLGRIADTADSCSELVRLAAIQAVGWYPVERSARAAEALARLLEALSPAVGRLAGQLLLACPRGKVVRVLTPLTTSDNALARVRAKGLLQDATDGFAGRPVFSQGGETAPIADDDVLGQNLMLPGDSPFRWGLPGFATAITPRLDEYCHLLRQDEHLAEHWDRWFLSGAPPLDALPDLQVRTVAEGPGAEAAVAFGMDILGVGAGLYVEAFADYQDLPFDGATDRRIEAVMRRVFRQCTQTVVGQLRPPNPSKNTIFSEVLSTSLRAEMPGVIFELAYAELLKEALALEFAGDAGPVTPKRGDHFRRHVEHEWDRLSRHQDWYYGFWVWPRLGLDQMGRYCNDKRAKPRYRREIVSYLAYLATTIPVFRAQAQEARVALRRAFERRLAAGARRIVTEQRQAAEDGMHSDWDDVEKALHLQLVRRFDQAVADFDVHWLEPHPLIPMGTLSMAWEPLTKQDGDGSSLFPERHLSWGNLIERKIRNVIREQSSEAGGTLETVSFEDLGPDGNKSWDPGQTREDAREAEEILTARGTEGKAADAGKEASPSAQWNEFLQPTRKIEADGELVDCLDIEGAAKELQRSVSTLRRYDRSGELIFLRYGDRRYLPVREINRARVVVRRMSEWVKILGVSEQTVRNWMQEIPPDTDPLEKERLLIDRVKDPRGRKPQPKRRHTRQ